MGEITGKWLFALWMLIVVVKLIVMGIRDYRARRHLPKNPGNFIMKEALNLILSVCLLTGPVILPGCEDKNLPIMTTTDVNDITPIGATMGGTVTEDGGAVVELRGVCWGTSNNPTIENSKQYWYGGTGSYVINAHNLIPDTYYHVRAFAMNYVGTAYGNEVHFRTKPLFLSTLSTIAPSSIRPSSITFFSAEAGGYISEDGGTHVVERGICLSATENPTINDRIVRGGKGTGTFICNITDLKPGTLYHIRAYAITLAGVAYGDDRYFKTFPIPIVTTNVLSVFTQTSARVDGNVTWSGPDLLVWHTGFCYGTTTAPTYGDELPFEFAPFGDGREFTGTLTNLAPGTLYYVRAFATVFKDANLDYYNQFTLYGNEVTFTTSQ